MTARNRLAYSLFSLLAIAVIYGVLLLVWPYVQSATPLLRQMVARYFVVGGLARLIGGALILPVVRGEV